MLPVEQQVGKAGSCVSGARRRSGAGYGKVAYSHACSRAKFVAPRLTSPRSEAHHASIYRCSSVRTPFAFVRSRHDNRAGCRVAVSSIVVTVMGVRIRCARADGREWSACGSGTRRARWSTRRRSRWRSTGAGYDKAHRRRKHAVVHFRPDSRHVRTGGLVPR